MSEWTRAALAVDRVSSSMSPRQKAELETLTEGMGKVSGTVEFALRYHLLTPGRSRGILKETDRMDYDYDKENDV